jgi:hypothetical protein
VDDFWKFSPGILLLLEALKAVEGVIFVNQFLTLLPDEARSAEEAALPRKTEKPCPKCA